jgi:hypothetical protein
MFDRFTCATYRLLSSLLAPACILFLLASAGPAACRVVDENYCDSADPFCNPFLFELLHTLSGGSNTACPWSLSYTDTGKPQNWPALQSYLSGEAALGSGGTPTADETSITGLPGGGAWIGGVLAPDGKIYGIPWNDNSVLIIDPETNTADTTTITGITDPSLGGVLGPSGKIYAIPITQTSVLAIDPHANGSWCDAVALSPYFNKF